MLIQAIIEYLWPKVLVAGEIIAALFSFAMLLFGLNFAAAIISII